MMVVVLVSSLSILIIQVKKKNDDDDGSQAGNVYVCPSALLATANKNVGEGRAWSIVQYIYTNVYAPILVA